MATKKTSENFTCKQGKKDSPNEQSLFIMKRRLQDIQFPFEVLHHDGVKRSPIDYYLDTNQYHDQNDDLEFKDFLNKRQFRFTSLVLVFLALVAACSPIESEAFVATTNNQLPQQTEQSPATPTTSQNVEHQQLLAPDARNARSLASYDFKDWLPGLIQPHQVIVNDANQKELVSGNPSATPDMSPVQALPSTSSLLQQAPSISAQNQMPETQLMAPMGSSPAPDHMLAAASKKKKKMKMMKKKKKMEKKHKEWKKGKKHKKKKYESKKKKGGSSKKKKGKKEKKKWGMEKKGHKKKGNFKKKKWGSKKKMKKGHKKGKKGHKMLKDKGHKKKGFKKVYHKEEWAKKKKWHDIKREKKWNTKAKKWKKKWHQEKGKKYKGKHMKKYHKKNKHGKKYKKEKKSKWKKHKGEKFKKGHKKKKEEYSKKKEGGKKKKMKKMKKEMKKKKKG